MIRGMRDSSEFHRDVFPFDVPPRIDISAYPQAAELHITDTTLRDGQQGWRTLSVDESLRIYEMLHRLDNGKGMIMSSEVFPYTAKDRTVIEKITNLNYDFPRPIGWIRARTEDVDLLLRTALRWTVMLCSISDYHIHHKLGTTRARAVENYLKTVRYALEKGISLKVSLEDITRADMNGLVIPFVNALMDVAEEYGQFMTIKFADTLGLGLPFEEAELPRGIPRIVNSLRRKAGLVPEQLEFHGHNDFHLVVANHMAAWLHGAALSNCTLFGIGERAGNCPMEAMVMACAQACGSTSTIDLVSFSEAADLFRDLGLNIPMHYPLFGENAFRTRAGIHIDGLLKNPEVYLPFDTQKILGIKPKVSVDAYSGRSAVAYWICNAFGLEMNHLKQDARVDRLYSDVVKMYEAGRITPLADTEMLELVSKYLPEFVIRKK